MTEASRSLARAHGGRVALVCVAGWLCANACATGVESPLDGADGGGAGGPPSTAVGAAGTDMGTGGASAGTGGSGGTTATGPTGTGGDGGANTATGPGAGGASTTAGSGGSSGGTNGGAAGATSAGGNGGGASGSVGAGGTASGAGGAGTGGQGGVGGAGGMSKDASVADVRESGAPKDAPPDVPCPLGGTALSFTTASSQTVVIPGAAMPLGATHRTVEMWVFNKVTAPNWSPNHTIFEYGASGSMQTFAIDFDTFPRMELYVNPASLSYFFDTGITQDSWFHVAAVYDGNINHAYINGVEKGTGLVVGTLATTATSFYVGGGATRNYFTGSIDEVRVWNVARTQAQIQQNMNVRLVGTETGLVGYWRFDEGTGTTARDSAGANNGALTNAPGWVPSGATLMCR